MAITKQDALDYHSKPRPGKTEVVATKPCRTQRDLSLAYTPGVAVPCLEIEQNNQDAYKYTNKGNLVAGRGYRAEEGNRKLRRENWELKCATWQPICFLPAAPSPNLLY